MLKNTHTSSKIARPLQTPIVLKKLSFIAVVTGIIMGTLLSSSSATAGQVQDRQDCNDWPNNGSNSKCKEECRAFDYKGTITVLGLEMTGEGYYSTEILPLPGIYLYECKRGDSDDQCCMKKVKCGKKWVYQFVKPSVDNGSCPDPEDIRLKAGKAIWRDSCFSRPGTNCNGYSNPTG